MHHQNVMNAVCAQSSEESCYHESLSMAFIIIVKIKFSKNKKNNIGYISVQCLFADSI